MPLQMRNFIQDLDMFGYVINLNFNKNGNEFKTIIGGSMSLLIKIVIYLYIGLNMYNLFTLGNNDNSMEKSLTDYESNGKVIKYKGMDFSVFYKVHK